MISNLTLEKIDKLAHEMALEGKMALPMSDTPLAVLCNNTTITGINTGDDIIAKIATESDNSVHNAMMDELIEGVSRAVCGHIDFAKNIVNTSVKEVVGYISKNLEAYTKETVVDLKVERVSLPDFLKNKDIFSDIEGYAKDGVRKYIEPAGVVGVPNMILSDIHELMMVGSSNIDASIGTWVASKESGFIQDVFEYFFVDPKEHKRTSIEMIPYLNDINEGHDRAIAIYLISRSILNSKEFKKSVDMASILKQYLEVSSFKLLNYITKYEDYVEKEILVFGFDKACNKIKVCSEVYLPWLDKGNTPELLFGSFVLGGKHSSVADIEKNKDELTKAWTIHRAAVNSSYRNNYHNSYVNLLRDGFYLDMKNMTEPEKAYHEKNPDAMKTIDELLEKELKEVSYVDREDHYRTVTRVVTKARFFYTDVYKFLTTVDELSKDNNISLNEALDIATIEYVADYVSSQVIIR